MRIKTIHSCMYGISVGIIVCIIGSLRALLPYVEMNSTLYTFLLLCTSMTGSIVAVFAIMFRNPSPTQMFIRFLFLLFSLGIYYALGAYLRIWTSLLNLFAVHTTSASDNLSGLLLITYLFAVVMASMIAIIIKGICAMVKKS